MANTYVAVRPTTSGVLSLRDAVLAEFRSGDLDIAALYDEYDLPIDIYDKTDGMKFVGSIVREETGLAPLIRLGGERDA